MPLTKPIVGNSGKVYTELHIPKGTAVNISAVGHNSYAVFYQATTPMEEPSCYRSHARNEDLWGPDARVFRPERWFEMSDQVESPVGVYGNLYGHVWGSDTTAEH